MKDEKKQTKYYLLPDGSIFGNMKDAKSQLNVGGSFFKTLIKRNIVKIINESEAHSLKNTQSTDEKFIK